MDESFDFDFVEISFVNMLQKLILIGGGLKNGDMALTADDVALILGYGSSGYFYFFECTIESVGSSFLRVIHIGSISVKILVALEVGAAAVASPAGVLKRYTHSSSKADPSESSPPPVSVAPMVLTFLCLDDSDSDTEMPERHVSPTPYDAMITRFVHPPLAKTPRCSEAYLCWRSASLSSMYLLMTSDSSAGNSSSKLSAGPFRKRCRSPAAIVTSYIPATIALVPSRADLLPPRKRFRDSILLEDSVEEDIDTDVLKDIDADATAVEVALDRDVVTRVDAGIDMEVDVGVDVEDEVDDEDVYKHVIEIPLQRIEDIEIGQRELEARSLIASGERASLLDQVASLERSNVRIRDTMMMERARADRFWRHMSFTESELRQIRRFRYYDKIRFRRLETFANMAITHSGMSPEAIEALVNQPVEEALVAYEVTPAANALEAENQSQNGSDDDNGNGGNRNGGDGNGGNGNPNKNNRGARPVARECTYQDFMSVNHSTLRERKEFELTWWNSHKRTIRADAAFSMSWRELIKLMAEVYCPRTEIQKMESELWNLIVKNNDLSAYTQRFQELTMILQDAVRIANNLVDQKLKGYALKNTKNKRKFDNSQKENRRQQPLNKRQNVRGQNVARAYTAGNNERSVYNGPLPLCNKCKFHHEGPCTVRCGKCKKVGHLTRDCKVVDSTTSNQRGQVVNQRVLTCFECGRQGHYRSDCPKLKIKTMETKLETRMVLVKKEEKYMC
nr:hypothetical protein [Tanacetum cinerariifolium]